MRIQNEARFWSVSFQRRAMHTTGIAYKYLRSADAEERFPTAEYDEPTLIKYVDGKIVKEWWLTGLVDVAMFADMPADRPYNMRVTTDTSIATYALTGTKRAPRYAQPHNAASVTRTNLKTNEIVRHYFQGRFGGGIYKRADGGIYTLSIENPHETDKSDSDSDSDSDYDLDSDSESDFSSEDEDTSTCELSAVGREGFPSVMIRNSQPSVQYEGKAHYVFGDLKPRKLSDVAAHFTFTWLNSLLYRHENPAHDFGYAAIIQGERIWASGTWEHANLKRKYDLPTALAFTGRQTWLDGALVKGSLTAVYWRKTGGPTVITASGTPLWKRGMYPRSTSDIDTQPLRADILEITSPAMYQLFGTCYFNAVVNVMVCTPCFRNRIRVLLRSAPALPAVRFEQMLYELFYSLLCTERVPQRPVRQSNLIAQIEYELFGKRDPGGFAFVLAIIICETLGITWCYENIGRGRLRKMPPPEKDVFLLVANDFTRVPLEVINTNGKRMTLVGSTIAYKGHAVCGLMDLSGQPRIILDSNGTVMNESWYPEIRASKITKISDILAFYVCDAIRKGRPEKCSASLATFPISTLALRSIPRLKAMQDTLRDLFKTFVDRYGV